ncbi:unnamed protein product [Arctogadus glacialis]
MKAHRRQHPSLCPSRGGGVFVPDLLTGPPSSQPRLQKPEPGYEMKLFHGPSRSTTSGNRSPDRAGAATAIGGSPRRSASTEGGGV